MTQNLVAKRTDMRYNHKHNYYGVKMKKNILFSIAMASILALGLSYVHYTSVAAATLPLSGTPIEVNSVADGYDATGGSGTCETSTPGECTLRAAVQTANSNGNPGEQDHITFDIAGGGIQTISQTGLSYYITEPVQIDGYSQTGASANTNQWPSPFNGTLLIEVDSSGVTDPVSAIGVDSDEVTVKGLVLNNSFRDTIYVYNNHSEIDIVGNYFGTDPTGLLAEYAATGRPLYAGGTGLSDITIGGSAAEDRNIFAASLNTVGIVANNVVFQGNYVGVGSDGVTALPNATNANSYSVDIAGDNLLIGGAGTGEGNSFENNPNFAGLSVSGTTGASVLGNTFTGNHDGIAVYGTADQVEIGNGTVAGRNLLSGNDTVDGFGNNTYGSGVVILSIGGSVSVKGNYIGVASDGTTASPNGLHGIHVDGTSDVVIGGTTADEQNIIANNTNNGINIIGTNAEVSVLQNSIYSNTELGIDINPDHSNISTGEVTANDPLDPDTGPNSILNFPEHDAVVNGANTDIAYEVDVPSGDYIIHFYSNTTADVSGNGEGETYIDSDTFTSAGTGVQPESHTVTGNTFTNISATVTEVDAGTSSGYGATSEFGTQIVRERDVAVTKTVVDQNKVTTDGYIEYDISFTNNGPDTLDLTQFDADAGDPLNTALFNDIFPSNLSFGSVISGDADCSESNAANTFGTLFSDHSTDTVISCAYNGVATELADDGVLNFTLRFTVNDSGVKVFDNYVLSVPLAEDLSQATYQTAVSSGNDIITELGTTNNNLVTTSTTQPDTDISITKTLTDPVNYVPGGIVNYTITLTNNGPDPIDLADSDGSGGNPFATALFIDFLPPDMTFASTSTPNITCPTNAPAGATPFLANHSNYSLQICSHNGGVSNVISSGSSFDVNFAVTLAGDPNLNYTNYALAPAYPANDPELAISSIAFDGTRDAIDYSTENPYDNFAFSGAPTDVEIGAELMNPDDVIAGNTISYAVTFTNNGSGNLNLAWFQNGGASLFNGLFQAADLTLAGTPTTDAECADSGPGSAAFLGTAAEDHPEHQIASCWYTGSSSILSAGETHTVVVNFEVKDGFQAPINNYFVNTSTPSDSDVNALFGVIFSATEDILDGAAIAANNNFVRISSDASPIPVDDSSNSTTDDGDGGLSSTGQAQILIALLATVLLVIGLSAGYLVKRSNASR
jgi:CSLREA domain-containing protein